MRERIERERVRPPEAGRFHFKLGYGSLADVQFAVELSLMRFGGGEPEVRARGTLDAIEHLAERPADWRTGRRVRWARRSCSCQT